MRGVEWIILVGVVLLVGEQAHAANGKAELRSTSGSAMHGVVTLEEDGKSLRIKGSFRGLPPGRHGFHIHAAGACGNGGKEAGGHFNPGKRSHGQLLKDGRRKAHSGDLGNIEIGSGGRGRIDVVAPGLSLSRGRHNVAGRAFIVHAKPDDFGQPTGNAGGRIACGAIVLTAD